MVNLCKFPDKLNLGKYYDRIMRPGERLTLEINFHADLTLKQNSLGRSADFMFQCHYL